MYNKVNLIKASFDVFIMLIISSSYGKQLFTLTVH